MGYKNRLVKRKKLAKQLGADGWYHTTDENDRKGVRCPKPLYVLEAMLRERGLRDERD